MTSIFFRILFRGVFLFFFLIVFGLDRERVRERPNAVIPSRQAVSSEKVDKSAECVSHDLPLSFCDLSGFQTQTQDAHCG